ncbi:MAG: hypothetical protein NVS3B1_22130 [Marmoricola sp.]
MPDFEEHDGGLWLPRDEGARVESGPSTVVIDNQSGLPDGAVIPAMESYFENTASFGWNNTNTRYMSYQAQGSMLGRAQVYRPPSNVIEEIIFCRDLAERDDDVGTAIDAIVSSAYQSGYQNQHEDEQVQHTFDQLTEDNQLRRVFKEMHREWLISGQVNTASLFVRGSYDIRPEGVARVLTRNVATPLIGVLPAEKIRVIGDDTFFKGDLAYAPDDELAHWLREFFAASTSAARKRVMALQYPVRAAMFTSEVPVSYNDTDLFTTGMTLYRLNPDIVHRTTMAKGEWKYPRPPLTRNLPLLEAKRLLNVMDFALLQGATNYIVVVKKGSDQRPALPQELTNLQGVVQRAARSGVLVGDHRLQVDIVQPDLAELLNPAKRRMIGRKLALALLRVPEFGSDETGQSVQAFIELFQASVTSDRADLIDHVHRNIWQPTMKRNSRVFQRSDRPSIWMPKIVLQGQQFFNDYLLKLYDRGDLPRKFMVEYGGFDYAAVKAQKKLEQDNNHDEIFMPPPVPFTAPNQQNSPNADPNDPYKYGKPGGAPDNGTGRPRGSGPNNGAPGASPSPASPAARPTRVIRRTRGESVRAFWDDDLNAVVRIGEITERIIDEYPEAHIGRLTAIEKRAIEQGGTVQEGPVAVVPVAGAPPVTDLSAIRLGDGASLITGNRVGDGAIVTVALAFREPEWQVTEAENTALRWGFDIDIVQEEDFAAPALDETTTCPKCDQIVPTTGGSCSNCGYVGQPFKVDPRKRSPNPKAGG